MPEDVLPSVGCALRHEDAPVVEYRLCPTAMCPTRDSRDDSEKT